MAQRKTSATKAPRQASPRKSKSASAKSAQQARSVKASATAQEKPKATKSKAAAKRAGSPQRAAATVAKVLSSQVVWEGPLFRVLRDKIVEPTGLASTRDVIRHNGSVVILAVDDSGKKKDPWIVMERQYRHAANQFLWEIPAGKIEAGEDPLAGAQRELAEETGYQAKKWKPLVTYYASPGFLGEAMLVYLAEGLYAGEASPEEDERIELRLVRLSEILKMIEQGAIHDGKTLNAVLLYAWLLGRKRKK
jgi:ADP-ribose pyrophosphatase